MPDTPTGETKTDEDPKERVDRELIELLNELRVLLPGVQVMFAFLLVVPFSERFLSLSDLNEAVYFVALCSTTIASVLLIAPSTYHRLRFRRGDKERMLRTSNRLMLVGSAFLAVALAASVFMITDLLYEGAVGSVVAGVLVVVMGWLWYGMPLSRALEEDADR